MQIIKRISILFPMILLFSSGCAKYTHPISSSNHFRFDGSIMVDGLKRTYLLNLPPDYYESDSFALVIALHGGGGSSHQFEQSTGLTDKANAGHFVVVYPDGYLGPMGNRIWNAGTCCGAAQKKNIDDVKFISDLMDKLISDYKIDSGRIYITGHSNGGMLAYRLADELSSKIAAIAVNGCSMVTTSHLHPSRAVPILHIHSKLDTHVPFEGGKGTGIANVYFPPVDSVLNAWADIDSCNADPWIINYPGYVFQQWKGCAFNTVVELYLTDDGGHSWPGGHSNNPNADSPSKVINAVDLLWSFFQKFHLP